MASGASLCTKVGVLNSSEGQADSCLGDFGPLGNLVLPVDLQCACTPQVYQHQVSRRVRQLGEDLRPLVHMLAASLARRPLTLIYVDT
jgi:hypothetical protein